MTKGHLSHCLLSKVQTCFPHCPVTLSLPLLLCTLKGGVFMQAWSALCFGVILFLIPPALACSSCNTCLTALPDGSKAVGSHLHLLLRPLWHPWWRAVSAWNHYGASFWSWGNHSVGGNQCGVTWTHVQTHTHTHTHPLPRTNIDSQRKYNLNQCFSKCHQWTYSQGFMRTFFAFKNKRGNKFRNTGVNP